MSVPERLQIGFSQFGTDYNLDLVKGEKSDFSVKINGVYYAVLGDKDKEKLKTACDILNSVSLDSISSSEDLKNKLSAQKDVSFPSQKVGGVAHKTLKTSSVEVSRSTPVLYDQNDQIQQFVDKIMKCNGSKQEIREIFSTIPPDIKNNNALLLDIVSSLVKQEAVIKANHFFSLIPLKHEEMGSSILRIGIELLETGKLNSNVDALNCAYFYLSCIKFGRSVPPKGLQSHIDEVKAHLLKIAMDKSSPKKKQAAEIRDCIKVKEALGGILVKNEEELGKLRKIPQIDRAFELADTIQLRADSEKDPLMAPPGKIVSITKGGETIPMHVNITGVRKPGEPLVILEGGLGIISSDWQLVQKGMPKDIQVMSYDREGTGWSGKGTKKPTAENSLANLEAILKSQGLEPPYIFVGHSYGGFLGQFFTLEHPEQISGLVLVDSAIEGHETGPEKEKQTAFDYVPAIAQNSYFQNDLAHFLDEASSAIVHRVKSKSSNLKTYGEEVSEFMNSGKLLGDKLAASAAKSSTPVFSCRMKVITATMENIEGREIDDHEKERWDFFQQKQHELPQRSSEGEQVFADRSDHFIMYHQPLLIIQQICSLFKKKA